MQPSFDEQDTIGNSAVLAGLAAPACASADAPQGEAGSPDAAACEGGTEDDVMALRIAADMAQDGRWWRGQDFPSCHAVALEGLLPVLLPLAVRMEEALQGAEALAAFDASAARLERAASSVDPTWVARWYRPAMATLRHRILVETAMDAVDRGVETESDPAAVVAAIEALQSDLGAFWERMGMREAKLARKGASEFVKASEEVIRANPVRVWNPSSGAWQVLATYDQMAGWLALTKVVLMAAAAGPRVVDAVAGPAETGTPTDAVADFAGRAGAIVEGVAGVTGTTSLVVAKVLRLAALDSAVDAASFLSAAERLEKGAVAIGSSKALTGVLAGVSLIRNGAILLDADSTAEERADAAVGMAAATAELVGIATGAGMASGLAILIPASWWAFKATLMELGETRLGVTGALLVPEIDQLIVDATAVVDAEERAYAAWLISLDVTGPDWSSAYRDAAESFATSVLVPADTLRAHASGWRTLLLKATVDEVWALHEGALREPGPESIHAFAGDLAERVSALFQDLPHLIGVESGIIEDEVAP